MSTEILERMYLPACGKEIFGGVCWLTGSTVKEEYEITSI